jgi:hypothetical protein
MGNVLPTLCPAPGFSTDLGAPAKYLGADIDDEYGQPWSNVYASYGHFDKIYVNEIITGGVSDSDSDNGVTVDTLTVRKIKGPEPEEGQYNRVDFEDGIGVTHIFCNSEDENNTIFIGSYLSLHAGMHVFDDISLDEGGAIVFPDGSRLTSANSVATVNEDLLDEQQSTIQQQQETIASLEARIARLEEMLGINN